MKELIETYSFQEILLILITFALAIKGFVSFWDWGRERLKKVFDKETKQETMENKVQSQINQCEQSHNSLRENQTQIQKILNDLIEKVDILVESDKDDIKSFITKEYHYFCEEQKWIDDYSLDCIERRFKCYVHEGGNSFIEDLMKELRQLPKHPPVQEQE